MLQDAPCIKDPPTVIEPLISFYYSALLPIPAILPLAAERNELVVGHRRHRNHRPRRREAVANDNPPLTRNQELLAAYTIAHS